MMIDDMSNSHERQRLRMEAGPNNGRIAVQSASVTIDGKKYCVSPNGESVSFDPPLSFSETQSR